MTRGLLALILAGSLLSVAAAATEADHFRIAQGLYKQQKFDAYFGVAQWARLKLWPDLTSSQKDRWLALELVALARHCRWEDAHRLAHSENIPGPLTQEAVSILEVKSEYQRFNLDPTIPRLGLFSRLIQQRSKWSTSAGEFLKITDPSHLRVTVRSLCSAGS